MDMNRTKICIGIDLGTTNTSAAYSRLMVDGQVEVKDLDIRQKGRGSQRTFELLPSIMYRKKSGEEVVGQEAQKLKESIESSSSEIRYLENTKRYMGTRTTFKIDDHEYTPIEIAAKLLQHVKDYSQIKTLTDEYYTIITVPANFNNDQRNDTLAAAQRVGFPNVDLYDEPKAAILSFLHEESQKREGKLLDLASKKRILVIDIGGGTCDISVEDVEEKNGQYVFTHLAVGRKDLGGVDFDRCIGDELARKSLKGIPLTDFEVASIRDMGQRVKETLSDDIEDFIWDNYGGNSSLLYELPNWLDILEEEDYDCCPTREINGKTISFPMTVREFVNAINPLIYNMEDGTATNKDEADLMKNMETLIDSTLSDYDIDVESVDIIFLTGGMAKCFPLRAALYELYGKKIISPLEPFLAVSRGAALVNKYKTIDETSNDIMPNAVMIEMSNGRLKTLVKMGEQVPVTNTVPEIFKTVSRTGVVIRLYEGKNEFDSQLRRINNLYVIKFDEPQKPGREFKIEYSVDRTKRINFRIAFLDTGETHTINGEIREGK